MARRLRIAACLLAMCAMTSSQTIRRPGQVVTSPIGGGGVGGSAFVGIVPTGAINGTNRSFSLPVAPLGAIRLYVNGIRQMAGVDYTSAGTAILFASGNAPQVGDLIVVDYGVDSTTIASGPAGVTGAVGATGAAGPTGATGPSGATGPTGAAGTNGSTILNGTGAPSSGTGSNGDYYLRNDTSCLYGPKASGAWPGTCTSLIGPTGPTGSGGGGAQWHWYSAAGTNASSVSIGAGFYSESALVAAKQVSDMPATIMLPNGSTTDLRFYIDLPDTFTGTTVPYRVTWHRSDMIGYGDVGFAIRGRCFPTFTQQRTPTWSSDINHTWNIQSAQDAADKGKVYMASGTLTPAGTCGADATLVISIVRISASGNVDIGIRSIAVKI